MIDYLNPGLPAGLARVTMPVVDATAATLDGYGRLVDNPSHLRMLLARVSSMRARREFFNLGQA